MTPRKRILPCFETHWRNLAGGFEKRMLKINAYAEKDLREVGSNFKIGRLITTFSHNWPKNSGLKKKRESREKEHRVMLDSIIHLYTDMNRIAPWAVDANAPFCPCPEGT